MTNGGGNSNLPVILIVEDDPILTKCIRKNSNLRFQSPGCPKMGNWS
jgi:hypothetical protein